LLYLQLAITVESLDLRTYIDPSLVNKALEALGQVPVREATKSHE
jgi:hypothetical protein